MKQIIEDYCSKFKSKSLYIFNIIVSGIFLILLFVGARCLDSADYIIYFICLAFVNYLPAFAFKLKYVNNLKKIKISEIIKINDIYDSMIEKEKINYIQKNILNNKSYDIPCLINYLKITNKKIDKFTIKDIIIILIGLIYGASLNSGQLDLKSFAEALKSSYVLFLTSFMIYIFCIRIIKNAVLFKEDYHKEELLKYILELQFDNHNKKIIF